MPHLMRADGPPAPGDTARLDLTGRIPLSRQAVFYTIPVAGDRDDLTAPRLLDDLAGEPNAIVDETRIVVPTHLVEVNPDHDHLGTNYRSG
jgi:hypothetical protein